MRLFMYSIFDSCSGVYDRPFYALSDGEALRSFTDIAKDKEHPIGKHPEHYSMYRLGDFDNVKAEIKAEDAVLLGKAHELAFELTANSLNYWKFGDSIEAFEADVIEIRRIVKGDN